MKTRTALLRCISSATFMSGKVLLTSYADHNFLNKTGRVIETGVLIHESKNKQTITTHRILAFTL